VVSSKGVELNDPLECRLAHEVLLIHGHPALEHGDQDLRRPAALHGKDEERLAAPQRQRELLRVRAQDRHEVLRLRAGHRAL
jgi:hypothetical protein